MFETKLSQVWLFIFVIICRQTDLGPDTVASRLMEAAFETNSNVLPTDNSFQLWNWGIETKEYAAIKRSQEYIVRVTTEHINQRIQSNEYVTNHQVLLTSSPLKEFLTLFGGIEISPGKPNPIRIKWKISLLGEGNLFIVPLQARGSQPVNSISLTSLVNL